MIITLAETHVHGLGGAHSVYYNWTLQSGRHFWFKRISGRAYYQMYWRYGNRAVVVNDLGAELPTHSRTGEYRIIHETEFVM